MSTTAKSIVQAGMNARRREIERERAVEEKKKSAVQEIEELTGEEWALVKKKKQNSRVAFTQIIQHNLQKLLEIGYLDEGEERFLFKISSILDFKTNVIVEKTYKNLSKNKKEQTELKAASVTYVAQYCGFTRPHTSKIMNGLKEKGILATAETGMVTETGRTCTSRTWIVNPNVMICGDKDSIDPLLQMIFKNSLKNLRDSNGKKVELPIKLFL